jgi:hypothetical protein
MKQLLENWKRFIDEVEDFDDFADTAEKIDQNLQYYYRDHAPTKGKRKDLGEWEENQLVSFELPEDNVFFFVVDQNDDPLAYIAVAPFRESYAVGNMTKKTGEKSFFQTELYKKVMETLGKGSLYSDKAQTTGGKGLWARLEKEKRAVKIDTSDEDGKGKWRWRLK